MDQPGTLAARQLARWLLGLAVPVAFAAAAAPLPAAGVATVTFAVAMALVWRARRHLGPTLGLANRVTVLRTALTCLLAGLVLWPEFVDAWRWPVIAFALGLAALDLADGRLARWRRETSHFGALVDGETDALYVLVLAVLAAHAGVGAPLALAIGLLRYAMLAAQLAWPRLRGHVPSSPAAKWICAAQIAALVYGLAPGMPAKEAVCAAALVALVWSFSRDVRVLLARR